MGTKSKEKIIGIALMILGLTGIVTLSLIPVSITISPTYNQVAAHGLTIEEIIWQRASSQYQYECYVAIPQIQGYAAADVAGINADILIRAQNLLSHISDDIAAKDGKSAIYVYTTTYKINKGVNNIIDIIISSYTYTGGIHGMSYNTTYHLDTISGKELSFNDIFKAGAKEYFESKILAQMAQKPDNYFEDAKPDVETVNFYFNNGDVVFVFGLYDITPYVRGMPEFKFSKDDTKQWLKKP